MEETRVREIQPEDAKLLDPYEISHITLRNGDIVSVADGGLPFNVSKKVTDSQEYIQSYPQQETNIQENIYPTPPVRTTKSTFRTDRVEGSGILEDRYNYRFYVSGVGYVNSGETQIKETEGFCDCQCHNVCDCPCHGAGLTTSNVQKTTTTTFKSKRAITPQVYKGGNFGDRFVYTERVKQPLRAPTSYKCAPYQEIKRTTVNLRSSQGYCPHCTGCVHCSGLKKVSSSSKIRSYKVKQGVKKDPEYLDNYKFTEIKGTCPPKKKKK